MEHNNILDCIVHHCQLPWCFKQSNFILELFLGAAGELCVSKDYEQLMYVSGLEARLAVGNTSGESSP